MDSEMKATYTAVVKGFADVIRRNSIDVRAGISAETLSRFLFYNINNLLENNLCEFEIEEPEIDENGDGNFNKF